MAEIEKVSEPEDAERLIERSRERQVVVFKHSVTCGVSAGARRRFESFVAGREGDEVDFVLLEVQHARPLSNALAEATGVRHQSPQAILLRGGKAVWDSSHGRITEEALGEALAVFTERDTPPAASGSRTQPRSTPSSPDRRRRWPA